MRVAIIKADNLVMVDGEGRTVDCSALPADFHALQWYGFAGEVEYASEFDDYVGWRKKPNEVVHSLEPYQALLDAWETAKPTKAEV